MIDRIAGLEHLVILGAGATCAAFPDGDASGRVIPAMSKFMEETGLIEKFPDDVKEEIKAEPNLEDLFSKWSEDPSRKTRREKLEKEIRGYLTNLESIGMNLYVKLLLSLTARDVIATFNWDPLLPQIYRKLWYDITDDLPHLLFLHGNVAMGYCPHCRRIGYLHEKCVGCDKDFAEMPLLYPVKNKNYNANIYIRSAWEDLGKALAKASVVTFFGYSAPVSDTAAKNMMNEAFRQDPLRNIVEFQLINTADETELRNSYGDFNIKPNHMSIVSSFYDSYIARYPRRSADNLYNAVMFCRPFCYPEKLSVTKEDGIFELIMKIKAIERNSLNENGLRRLEIAKSIQDRYLQWSDKDGTGEEV